MRRLLATLMLSASVALVAALPAAPGLPAWL